jgi:uncharacterized damage-inducible protein DinB
MYRRLDDFLEAYEQTAAGTSKILGQLTDGNLGTRIAPGHRTLGEIAWHVVVSVPEMMGRTGLPLASVDPEAAPPAAGGAMPGGYAAVAGELRAALGKQWNDDTLAQLDDMYGQKWPRGQTLAILIHHEIHHTGQMTVLLRQAGQSVPGTHGPSKEEWAQFGMPAPTY